MAAPPDHVLDLFAVPPGRPLPGGQGGSVQAGDLVLSPGRDADVTAWLSPLLARLAVSLDERPGRRRRDLRVAVPVPARDGSWTVDGWAASRWEPGSTTCDDLDVVLAAGALLHAELATLVGARPEAVAARDDRWARAERLAFGPGAALAAALPDELAWVARSLAELDAALPPDPEQLVHADLWGNVLLDAAGAPVVIDVAPAWRPVRWTHATCVVDAVAWGGADLVRLDAWRAPAERRAALRALAFRVLSDPPGSDTPEVYRSIAHRLH